MGDDASLIDRFLEMMAAERGASRNTLLAYRADLMGAAKIVGGLSGATKDDIGGLADAWAGLAASSVARKASALRAFYAFLEEEGLRADNPSTALPRPATRRPLPKILSTAEVDSLFVLIAGKLAAEHPAPLDLRLSALIELLYGSGLRATELVSLPRRALASDRPFLILKGKGARERLVPLSDRGRAARAAWLPPGSRPNGSAPMSCAMPLLPICWRAGRICALCNPCWGMPISAPRKSTPMSTAVAWSNW